ncbi:uncharacterized protein LOC119406687 [Rhipicephalus sanguineus]|uniref:uncharacterized protein LOC119406687 n=1 Tax=Rhipicephalus sanguineus TaxID=34632 RepID=UPI0018957C82|nr:uncharacterized protein LOC119406687 [Rhipicephalus sanguineus]
MGAAVSVTAANLTMERLEQRALGSFCPAPKTFLRYVDDCFSIIKKEALNVFTQHLDDMNAAIKFAVEEELHGKLPFLDVLVKREGEGMSFSVYRKSTHTGRYLHFNSVNPVSHKSGVSSIPVVLVPLGSGSIRLNNPKAIQEQLHAVTSQYQSIPDVRQFGRGESKPGAMTAAAEADASSLGLAEDSGKGSSTSEEDGAVPVVF